MRKKICSICENKHYARDYCKKHYKRFVENPKRIWFKDRRIELKQNPKTHVCSLCRKQGLTHMHHLEYHYDDPIKDTIELCVSCHNKQRNKDIENF